MARPAAGSKRQRPDNRGHLRASAHSAASGQLTAPHLKCRATRFRPVHDEAGSARTREARAVPAHVVGCPLGRSESPRCKVLSRQLDAKWPAGGTISLTCSRTSASSRPDFDAAHRSATESSRNYPASGMGEALKQAGLKSRARAERTAFLALAQRERWPPAVSSSRNSGCGVN